jgi:hypothetical protein
MGLIPNPFKPKPLLTGARRYILGQGVDLAGERLILAGLIGEAEGSTPSGGRFEVMMSWAGTEEGHTDVDLLWSSQPEFMAIANWQAYELNPAIVRAGVKSGLVVLVRGDGPTH